VLSAFKPSPAYNFFMAPHVQIAFNGDRGRSERPIHAADITLKLRALEARLGQLGSLMVAYSGWTLRFSPRRIGSGQSHDCLLADSPACRRDFEQACEFARAQGIPHALSNRRVDAEYQRNDAIAVSLQRRTLRCHGDAGASLGFESIAYG